MNDPTKPVGYRFLNNAPADGAKVWITVSIYDHGKLHWRKRYFSNYPAVDGVTIVGTKRPDAGAVSPSHRRGPTKVGMKNTRVAIVVVIVLISAACSEPAGRRAVRWFPRPPHRAQRRSRPASRPLRP